MHFSLQTFCLSSPLLILGFFPQGRVTDHTVGITYHSVDDVMQGENLDVFIDALLLQEEMDAMATFSSSQ